MKRCRGPSSGLEHAGSESSPVLEESVKYPTIVLLLFLVLLHVPAWTQSDSSQSSSDGFVSDWFERSSRAESDNLTGGPDLYCAPRLVQQFRCDMG